MKEKRVYLNSAFLIVTFLLTSAQTSLAGPLDNVDYSVRLDGTMELRGGVDFFVFDFGSASGGTASSGPIGIKEVSMAQDLHVAGEHNKELLKPPPQRDGGSITITGGTMTTEPGKTTATVTLDDHSKEGGWPEWYGRVAHAISRAWSAKVAGQAQVVVEVSKSGKLTALKTLAFIPAINKSDMFETEQTHPNLRADFVRSIDDALASISKDAVAFPAGSTANSACVLATFTSDNNLSVDVPDLALVNGIAHTQPALRTYRICTILETGAFYKTSDLVKASLPKEYRVCYVPIDAAHSLYSPGHNFYVLAFGSGTQLHKLEQSLGSSDIEKIAVIIQKYISGKHFSEAEDFAKAVVASNAKSLPTLIQSEFDLANNAPKAVQ